MDREMPLTGILNDVVFRYSAYDTPLWARNNRDPGRWHVPADGATQYLSLSPDGAWAELARAENLLSDQEVAQIRMPIWALRLSQQNLVDYSSFDKAEAAGFLPDALIDDDYTRCQAEGRRLRQRGYAGVVTPSAALPGAANVTLFGRRMLSTWNAPTRLASSIPGCVVAVGCPPPGLVSRVRFFGDAHAALSAYIEGRAERARLEYLQLDKPAEQAGGLQPNDGPGESGPDPSRRG